MEGKGKFLGRDDFTLAAQAGDVLISEISEPSIWELHLVKDEEEVDHAL